MTTSVSARPGDAVTSIAEHRRKWRDLPVLKGKVIPVPEGHPDHDGAVLLDSYGDDFATITLVRDNRRPNRPYELAVRLHIETSPVTGWYVRIETEDEARVSFRQAVDLVVFHG